MRTLIHTLVLIVSISLLSAAQTATTPPASKAAAAEPAAIIHTTAGDLHCTLFPKA